MRDLRPWALHAALLLSGAAALFYQLAWTRMLHRVFGIGDVAVATVLASFFLGLGLGSALAARWARRIVRPARIYAVLELAIGVYALLSLVLLPGVATVYDVLGPGTAFATRTAVRFVLACLLLAPPTVLMGATLPVGVLALWANRSGWSRGVTALYVTNTLGAVGGTAVAGLWLLPFLGTRASIAIAAAASVVAAGLVGLVFRGARIAPATDADEAVAQETSQGGEAPDRSASSPSSAPHERAESRRLALAAAFAATAGLTALAGEVLWTRVLRTFLQGSTQAFAAMLVNYLAGIALGSFLVRRFATGRWRAERLFGTLQAIAAVLIGLAMTVAAHLPRIIPLLRGDLDMGVHEVGVVLLVSAALLLPLATVTGAGLPVAWMLAESARERNPGAGSGRLLAANTLGGLAGSLLAAFALVPTLGIEASLLLIAFVHLAMSAVAFRASASQRLVARVGAVAGPVALGAALLWAQPSLHLPFLLRARSAPVEAMIQGPGSRWRDDLAFLEEGRSTTVTVTKHPGNLRLQNDGRPESGFSAREPGFGAELALLGGLPSLFAERTDRALVIGLGAGHTTTMLLAGPWKRVTVAELEQSVVDAARLMHEARGKPFPLDDPRAELAVDDGRHQLGLTPDATLDAVVSQPSHPWLAGVSALYSQEFFAEVKRALRPGGVLAIWINLFRMDESNLRSVVGTLRDAFPHVQAFRPESSSLLFCASDAPPLWDEHARTRLAGLEAQGPYLGAYDLGSLPRIAGVLELGSSGARAFGEGARRITDDRMRLEWELARLPNRQGLGYHQLDELLRAQPWIHEATLRGLDAAGRRATFLARIGRARGRPAAVLRVRDALAQDGFELDPAGQRLVEGALAEARGDVERALSRYDASASPAAAQRADQLRLLEGRAEQALRIAVDRETAPASAQPLLLAALRLDSAAALQQALDIAAGASSGPGSPLRALVAGYAEGGCGRLLSTLERDDALAHAHGEVAALASRCAARADAARAEGPFMTLAVRARRHLAQKEGRLGDTLFRRGAPRAAEMHLRRAVRAYPSDTRAAGTYAELLAESGRRDRATAVLRRAAAATEGLPSSQARLAQVARKLKLELELEAPPQPRRERSPSSTSTVVEPGDRGEDDSGGE